MTSILRSKGTRKYTVEHEETLKLLCNVAGNSLRLSIVGDLDPTFLMPCRPRLSRELELVRGMSGGFSGDRATNVVRGLRGRNVECRGV